MELSEDKGNNQKNSISQLKEMIYADQSCFDTKKQYKHRLFKDEKGKLLDLDIGFKIPTEEIAHASAFKTLRSQRTLQRKQTISKKK